VFAVIAILQRFLTPRVISVIARGKIDRPRNPGDAEDGDDRLHCEKRIAAAARWHWRH